VSSGGRGAEQKRCRRKKGNGGGSPLATPMRGNKALTHVGGGDRLGRLHRVVSAVSSEMVGAWDRITGFPG
jgi:hypothetical protein